MDLYPWAVKGARVRLKPVVGSGRATITDIGDWAVSLRDPDHRESVVHLDRFFDEWEPDAPAADAALEQIKGAVLHELRSSGPLGLSRRELHERIGAPWEIVDRAALDLVTEGRARWDETFPEPLLCLTACQRALDEARAEVCNAWDEADRRLNQWANTKRALDEARAAEEALRRGVETFIASTLAGAVSISARACRSALQSALDGASAEGVHLLERLDEAEAMLNDARREVATHRIACGAACIDLEKAQRELDDVRAEISRLESALNEANVHANESERELSVVLRTLAADVSCEDDAYAEGLIDAAFVVGAWPRTAKKTSARIVFQEGTTASVLVLRDNGPRSDPANARFVLGSARFGRMHADENGMIIDSPIRIHPDDLAVLKGGA